MGDESGQIGSLDSVDEIVIRWRLAAAYLLELNTDDQVGDRALRTLVNRDVPMLLRQIKSLKPELWLSDQEPPGVPGRMSDEESPESRPPDTKAASKGS